MQLHRRRMLSALLVAAGILSWSASARAQEHWLKLAPFPDPCPELIGAAAGGKVYVFGGLLGTSVKGLVYEYDPAADKWTKKKRMPIPAHHVAAVEYRGKIYLFGGGAQPDPAGETGFRSIIPGNTIRRRTRGKRLRRCQRREAPRSPRWSAEKYM